MRPLSSAVIICVFYLLAVNCAIAAEDPNELYTGPEFSKAFSNPKDDPNLPNVLLIGDSISIGYTVSVRKLLKGKADVFRIPTNGRYAAYGVQNLDKWLTGPGVKWDVIHFNWGLWDLCYRHPGSKTQGNRDKVNGTVQATPEQYKEHLTQAVAKLKTSGATLIWCATTPVPDDEAGRIKGDDIIYNGIAEEIMKQNDIRINDLYNHSLLKTPSIFTKKGDVHFNQEGYAYLAEKIAAEIEATLPKK